MPALVSLSEANLRTDFTQPMDLTEPPCNADNSEEGASMCVCVRMHEYVYMAYMAVLTTIVGVLCFFLCALACVA